MCVQLQRIIISAALLGGTTASLLGEEIEYRTWTNKMGKSAVLAYLRVSGDDVVLRDKKGREYKFPVAQLSENDQRFIKNKAVDRIRSEIKALPAFQGRGGLAMLRDLAKLKEATIPEIRFLGAAAQSLVSVDLQRLLKGGVGIIQPVPTTVFDEPIFVARYGKPDKTSEMTSRDGPDFKKGARYLHYEWLVVLIDKEGHVIALGTKTN